MGPIGDMIGEYAGLHESIIAHKVRVRQLKPWEKNILGAKAPWLERV